MLAFTLAEMMVVLLIMSIVLACMAPVMTTKMKADQSIQTSPWRWAENNRDAYFSVSSAQSAMIGQNEKGVGEDAKLIIQDSLDGSVVRDMILFKHRNNPIARLRFQNSGLMLGTFANGFNGGIGPNSIAIGLGTSIVGDDTVIGTEASGSNNSTAIGRSASALGNSISIGDTANSADSSIAIGNNILSEAEQTLAIGHNSSVIDIGGIAIGNNSSSSGGIAIGDHADATSAVAIGENSSAEYLNSIAIGNNSQIINSNYSGNGSIAIGSNIYLKGYGPNTLIGYNVMPKNGESFSGRCYNTLVGYEVANKLISAGSNSILGHRAGYNITTGSNNTSIGYQSLYSSNTASNNTAVGYEALYSNITGTSNIAVGVQALKNNTTGSNNTALGALACQYVTGSNKTCIGAGSGPSSGSALASNTDKIVFIGDSSTTVYIQGTLIVGGKSYLGYNPDKTKAGSYSFSANDSALFVNMGSRYDGNGEAGPIVNSYNEDAHLRLSDRRLKYVGTENRDGLAKLRQIKVFNYTFKKDDKKTPRVGVMAQDLQKIFPNAVKKASDGFLTIRMEDMFYAVINAVKELDRRVTRLEKENKELRARLEKLEAKLK